ncbi:MAG: TSUP family transporter [Planctomycetota bacterium]
MSPQALALVGVCVALGFGVQALTGFGGVAVALTLGSQVVPIARLVPLVAALSLLQTGWLLVRHHEHIAWPLLLRRIVPLMVCGAVAGQVLGTRLSGRALELCYGAFVVLAAAQELWAARRDGAPRPPLPRPLAGLLTLVAGVIHGIYAAGGPLLVYVVGREGLAKSTFRSTLLAVWFVLNLGLTISFAGQGRLVAADAPALGWWALALILGLALGEWGHARVDERRFRLVANALLLLAGSALFLPALKAVLARS